MQEEGALSVLIRDLREVKISPEARAASWRRPCFISQIKRR